MRTCAPHASPSRARSLRSSRALSGTPPVAFFTRFLPPREGTASSRARGALRAHLSAHPAPARASHLPPAIASPRIAGAHPVRAGARREDRPQHRPDESPRPARARRYRRRRAELRRRLHPSPPQESHRHPRARGLPHRPTRAPRHARQLQRRRLRLRGRGGGPRAKKGPPSRDRPRRREAPQAPRRRDRRRWLLRLRGRVRR